MDKTCDECGTAMLIDPCVLLLSDPPRPVYYCPKCTPLIRGHNPHINVVDEVN
jgi:hypothetical protein